MTTTSPTRPLSDPHTRGLHLRCTAVMALIRLGVLIGADLLLGRATPASADPVGAGISGFLLTVAITGAWAIVDGWRRPLRTGAGAWVATSALYVILGRLPEVLSYPADQGGWTGLGDYLAMVGDGFGFLFVLTALPAAAGLCLGQVIRVLQRHTRP